MSITALLRTIASGNAANLPCTVQPLIKRAEAAGLLTIAGWSLSLTAAGYSALG